MMCRKIQLVLGTVALGSALIVGCPGVGTQVGSFSPVPTNPDDFFLWEATVANLAEIEVSQLAQSKSQNAAILAHAQQVISDHTAAQAQVAQLAQQRGLALPTVPDEASRLLQQFLQQLPVQQFEQEYLSDDVAGHAKNLSMYVDRSLLTQDANIRAFAAAQVPVLRAHLAAAIPINQSLGGGAGPCAGTTASGTTIRSGTGDGGMITGGTTTGGVTGGATGGATGGTGATTRQ